FVGIGLLCDELAVNPDLCLACDVVEDELAAGLLHAGPRRELRAIDPETAIRERRQAATRLGIGPSIHVGATNLLIGIRPIDRKWRQSPVSYDQGWVGDGHRGTRRNGRDIDNSFAWRQSLAGGAQCQFALPSETALKNHLGQPVKNAVLIAFFRFVAGWIPVVQPNDRARAAQLNLHCLTCRRHDSPQGIDNLYGHRHGIATITGETLAIWN